MKAIPIICAAASLICAQTETKTTSSISVKGTVTNSYASEEYPKAKVTLKTPDTTATTQTDFQGKFEFTLNPVSFGSSQSMFKSGSITIQGKQLSIIGLDAKEISIHNLLGKVLFRTSVSTKQISVELPNLAKGLHLLTLTSRTGEKKTFQWSENLHLTFGTKETPTSNPITTRSEIDNEVLPDTLKISAPGYPLLTIPCNFAKGTYPQTISMIDSSKGSAKEIEVQKYIGVNGGNSENLFIGKYPLEQFYLKIPDSLDGKGSPTKYLISGINTYSSIETGSNEPFSVGNFFRIDLDTVPDHQTSIFGTVVADEKTQTLNFMGFMNYSFNLCFMPNHPVLLQTANGTKIDSTNTDAKGRFCFKNVAKGIYTVKIFDIDGNQDIKVVSFIGKTYQIDTQNSRRVNHVGKLTSNSLTVAPNIYLYPKTKSEIAVNVTIRENGSIPFSIPEYENEWRVSATPKGRINDSLGFLYYDFISPIAYQSDSGWVLSYKNFDSEVTKLLSTRGLNKQEILDFIDFWKKYIPVCDWVTLCPSDANTMVELTVSPSPKTLFRELYLVLPSTGAKPTIKEPSRGKPFVRKGFTVVEWGGHLEGLNLEQVIKDKMK